jgi:hypothetical protein
MIFISELNVYIYEIKICLINFKWSVINKTPDLLPKIVIGLCFNEKFDTKLIKGPASMDTEVINFLK